MQGEPVDRAVAGPEGGEVDLREGGDAGGEDVGEGRHGGWVAEAALCGLEEQV